MTAVHEDVIAVPDGRALVGGRWVTAEGGRTFASTDPATGAVVGTVPDMGRPDAAQAVAAARAAFGGWSRRTAAERADALLRWHALMLDQEEALATLLVSEQGKPFAEAVAEVRYAASFLRWSAGEAERAYGRVVPTDDPGARVLVTKHAAGVVAVVTPWNFPYAMVTRKVGAAVAAGCTCVVKPAPETPRCALALASLAEAAGLPAGVLNVVTCDDPVDVGAVLTTHPDVRVVSFTGSTAVGRLLLAQAAPTVKRVALELGGNAPFVVFGDADLDLAVRGAMAAKFRNGGQACIAANRILVQRDLEPEFTRRLVEAVAALVVGPGLAPGTTLGPLVSAEAAARVDRVVADAVAAGAEVACGGRRHPRGPNFYEPTVLRGVTPGMEVAAAEVFGPVAPVLAFDDEATAVRWANDTTAGLAAYVYTADAGRMWRMVDDLDVGIVGVNDTAVSTPTAPFGGVKQSGLGREGGTEGIEEFLEVKHVRWGGIPREASR